MCKATIVVVLGLFCFVKSENQIGWNKGISYRYKFENYLIAIRTMPTIGNSASENRRIELVANQDKKGVEGYDFKIENALYLGRSIYKYKYLNLYSGVEVGHEYSWGDQNVTGKDIEIQREWSEENVYTFNLLFSPSVKIYERFILETDYGIEYFIQKSKTNLAYRGIDENETRYRTTNSDFYGYSLVGDFFSLRMGLKAFLKI